MMRTFSLKCKVITPLFIGGANQQAELRTQSINGLLRWWFRIAGGSIEDEKRLFGWAGEKSNQGLVRIFIKNFDELQKNKFSKDFDNEGRVRQDKGINYIGFSLEANEEDIKKFFCALWLAFNLGNFGSRSRRGFGSVMIEDVQGNFPHNFKLEFKPKNPIDEWLKSQLNYIKSLGFWQERIDIPFVFSNNFKIYRVIKENFKNWGDWIKEVQEGRNGKYLVKSWGLNQITNITNWQELLDFMGFLLMAFRSYRNPDYQNAKNILRGNRQSNLFERPIFGLPLNFYFSSLNRGNMVHLKLGNDNLRRASPLMIKIIQSESGYEGLFIVMKSTFMPANSRLVFSNESINLPEENIWEALDGFIESLERHNLIDKIYPKEI
jgi:CRISPR-associated protein Cmr1